MSALPLIPKDSGSAEDLCMSKPYRLLETSVLGEPRDEEVIPITTGSGRQSKRSCETVEDMKENKMEEPNTTASDPRDHCDSISECPPLQYVSEVPCSGYPLSVSLPVYKINCHPMVAWHVLAAGLQYCKHLQATSSCKL